MSGLPRLVRTTLSMFFFAKNPDRRVATALKKKRERRPGCAPVAPGNRASRQRGSVITIYSFSFGKRQILMSHRFPSSLTDLPRL